VPILSRSHEGQKWQELCDATIGKDSSTCAKLPTEFQRNAWHSSHLMPFWWLLFYILNFVWCSQSCNHPLKGLAKLAFSAKKIKPILAIEEIWKWEKKRRRFLYFVGYILQPNIKIWKFFLFSLWLKTPQNTDFFHYPLKFTNWCKFSQKNNLKQFLFIFFS
jgi:hypothetical protein